MWHHFRQVFPSCSATQSRPSPFFLPGCTFRVATSIACCLSHLARVTRTLAVGGDICQAIATAAFTLFISSLWLSYPHGCSCGLADWPSCYLHHVSRLLGLTLRLFAPVFRCHRVSWARGRLALAQEAVRVSPFVFFSIFLFLFTFVRSFRLPSSKFSSSGVEV